jgi:hypothetical protein
MNRADQDALIHRFLITQARALPAIVSSWPEFHDDRRQMMVWFLGDFPPGCF